MKRVFKFDNNGPLKKHEGFLKEKKNTLASGKGKACFHVIQLFSFFLQNCSAGFAASLTGKGILQLIPLWSSWLGCSATHAAQV